MKALLGASTQEMRDWCVAQGWPAFRGSQLARWIYRRDAASFEAMTNLTRSLRAALNAQAVIGHLPIAERSPSRDGSVKLLLRRSDGEMIESVGLPYPDRVSCCVSSQLGCPIGCRFCATGLSGFSGNLTAGEIVAQALAVQSELRRSHRQAATIDHVVFMGMGEPLLNYNNVLKAVRLFNQEMGIAMRHLTVSTVGLVPQMRRLAREKLQLTLAVSLHAPTNELRHELVPGTRGFSIEEIVGAARDYAEATGRRVTFEYVLLRGVNDTPGCARRLAGLLRDTHSHVNLIPFNPVADTAYHAPAPATVKRFREILEAAQIPVSQRVQRGADAAAACGQLRRRATALAMAPV